MMRLIHIGCLLLLAACSASDNGAEERWKTYTNAVAGYTLDYPPDWQVSDDEGGVMFSADTEHPTVVCATMFAFREKLAGKTPERLFEDEVSSSVVFSIQQQYPGAEELKHGETTLGGLRARYALVRYKAPQFNSYQRVGSILTLANSGVYSLACFAAEADFVPVGALLERMRVSFRIHSG